MKVDLAQRDRAQYRLVAEPSAIGLNNPLTESNTPGPIPEKPLTGASSFAKSASSPSFARRICGGPGRSLVTQAKTGGLRRSLGMG
jgi:hypothetical protein